MIEYAYHCSSNGDIKEFIPHVSSHGKAYVYATPNKSLALVFGVPEHSDYVVHPLYDSISNTCTFVEMQPDALAKYYRGKSAYLYTVNKDDFTESTGWKGEICSPNPVKPIKVEYIEDLEAAILNEQKTGRLNFVSFEQRNDNERNMDDLFSNRELINMLCKNKKGYIEFKLLSLMLLPNKEIFVKFKDKIDYFYNCFSSNEHLPPIKEEEDALFSPAFIERCKSDSSSEFCIDIYRKIQYSGKVEQKIIINKIKSIASKELLQKILEPITFIRSVIKENISKVALIEMIENNKEEENIKYIKKLKAHSDRGVYTMFKEELSKYLEYFSSKEKVSIPEDRRIVPDTFLDRYKTSSSNENICDIFKNLAHLSSSENIKRAISEIKSTDNKELIRKIIFRLTKLNNIVKEIDAKAPIVQSKTME